jgi:NADPH:quinone reductase-like Zn-dependent oxidoreductase
MPQMKAIRFHAPGGPEKLKLALEPIPTIGKNEVLIKVRAVGLIWPELSWPIYQKENGEYITHIPGHDFSGIITEIGSGTDSSFDLKVGDEVIAFTSRRNHDGGMAEYAVSDIDQVIPKPKNLDFIESAAVPLSALTAW